MTRLRHKARTVALQGLYQLDVQRSPLDTDIGTVLAALLTEAELEGKAADYALSIAAGAWAKHERYDEMIAGVSDHWDVSRMAVVDRNILRLALYELTEQADTPVCVVMDEAIEIGREFGSEETPHFINGVLDAVWKRHETCRDDQVQADAPADISTSKDNQSETSHGTV